MNRQFALYRNDYFLTLILRLEHPHYLQNRKRNKVEIFRAGRAYAVVHCGERNSTSGFKFRFYQRDKFRRGQNERQRPGRSSKNFLTGIWAFN